jgi:hypothetical protein
MKKILSFMTVALLVFICQNVSAQSFSSINALKFASINEYKDAVDSNDNDVSRLQSIDGFSSYTSLESTRSNEQPPEDPGGEDEYDVSNDQPTFDKNDYFGYGFLTSLLNSDKIVVIGDWICKVDLPNDRVLVLNKNNMGSYNDFINGNLSNSDVLNFSTSNEVVDLLDQMDSGTPYSELDFEKCSDPTAGGDKDDAFFYNGNRKRLDAKASYERAGIFFSLIAKAKTQKRFLGIWWHDGNGYCSMSRIELDYKIRCKGGVSYYGNPCQFGCLPGYSAGSTCSYRPYSGFTALKYYRYQIDFSSTHGSGRVKIEN